MTTEFAEPIRRRIARWVLRLFFLPLGVALIAFSFALLVLKEDYALVDDTHAWLGAGTSVESDANVPVVIDVTCIRKKRSFRSTDRAGSWLGWRLLAVARAGGVAGRAEGRSLRGAQLR